MTRVFLRASVCAFGAAALALSGCDSSAIPPSSGVGNALVSGSFAVVASDYRSTNVTLRAPDGARLTSSLLSTASVGAGLSFALSGDVVLPSEPLPTRAELVLIDRYGTNVLTFVDVVSGRVRAQLPVGTGFESNPQDFLALEGDRALVARFGVDPRPGDVALDGGDDVLVVDTKTPALLRRIGLPRKDGIPARPGAFTRFGGEVYVNLHRLAPDFDRAVDADLAVIDAASATLERVIPLPGLRNCGKAVFSELGRVAFACSGLFDPARTRFDDVGAGVVIGDFVDGAFRESERWSAANLGATPTGSVAWISNDRVVASLFGSGARGDALWVFRPGERAPSEIYRASAPYVLGAIRCVPDAAFACATPDASSSAIIQLFQGTGSAAPGVEARPLLAPDVTGLPLRDLAFFR